MTAYDKYYQEENYFGKPYPELTAFFKAIDRSKKILDLGCGQGRDALALGRLGFVVKGLDVSAVGIDQMNQIAQNERLNVSGMVGDYLTFVDIPKYDIILMDSIFHFYKKDLAEETTTINRILELMKKGSKLILIVQESDFRINHIKSIIEHSKSIVSIDFEQSFIYQEFDARFYMISIYKSV